MSNSKHLSGATNPSKSENDDIVTIGEYDQVKAKKFYARLNSLKSPTNQEMKLDMSNKDKLFSNHIDRIFGD